MAFEPAKYPGCTVLIQNLMRGSESGDVRIQDYGDTSTNRYHIATFLPGHIVHNPGDTPKVEPDHSCWRNSEAAARRAYKRLIASAEIAGWDRWEK